MLITENKSSTNSIIKQKIYNMGSRNILGGERGRINKKGWFYSKLPNLDPINIFVK
jgi:hypothetical protein